MLDVDAELRAIAHALDEANIPWALVGGLAVSLHARPRATDDIDLLVAVGDAEAACDALQHLGYEARSNPMPVAGGRLRIQRLLKTAGDDLMLVDLLLAEDARLIGMLARRISIHVGRDRLWIAALDDLRELKRLRGSPQDLADLAALDGEQEDE